AQVPLRDKPANNEGENRRKREQRTKIKKRDRADSFLRTRGRCGVCARRALSGQWSLCRPAQSDAATSYRRVTLRAKQRWTWCYAASAEKKKKKTTASCALPTSEPAAGPGLAKGASSCVSMA